METDKYTDKYTDTDTDTSGNLNYNLNLIFFNLKLLILFCDIKFTNLLL
jgi:hypothetical protein